MTFKMTAIFYKKTLVTFFVALLIGIGIANYFVVQTDPPNIIKVIANETQMWNNVVTAFIMFYSYVTLMRYYLVKVYSLRETRGKQFYGGILEIGTTVVFVLVALAFGGISGPQFSDLFKYLVSYPAGAAILSWLNFTYLTFRFARVYSVESTLFLAGWLITSVTEIPMLMYLAPWLKPAGTWLEDVVGISASRAGILVMGSSAIILAIRALVAKEPGLVELEVD